MEAVYLISLLVIIYLLITSKNTFNEKIDRLEIRILELHQLVKQNIDTKPKIIESSKPTESLEREEQPKPKAEEGTVTDSIEKMQVAFDSTIRKPVKTFTPPVYKQAEPELSFFERHPDLEKFIGENLINKIGIAILVLAIGFFVKYAIDNNWIGPVGRVSIGILFGGILLGIAHRLRNSYNAFSSVLVGGGLAILYFTITLAYHQFHLFDQTVSFIILIVITCFAVTLSMLYNKQEVAVIALIGGLSSPFMVSTGNANYNALFIYLIILNTGLLVIAYYKAWRILNIAAFGLTVIVVSGVVSRLTDPTYAVGLLYITVLYLMFFAMNVANNIRDNKKFISADFSILLINTALYFGAGLYLLTAMHHELFRGLFCAALAALNLVLSFILYRNRKADINVLYLLIGITLTFISLAAPIQLHGNSITLFWAAESVLLYWLYLKSGIKLIKLTSIIIWGVMLVSLLIDWMNLYSSSATMLTIIANKGFITTFAAAISSYLLYLFINKDEEKNIYGITLRGDFYRYTALALLFLSGLLEINHQFLTRYPATDLNNLYLMLYAPAFIYVLLLISNRVAITQLGWQVKAGLLSSCIVIYLGFTSFVFDVQIDTLVYKKISAVHFIFHWIGTVFISLLLYKVVLIIRDNVAESSKKVAHWLLTGAAVIFLSIEVSLLHNQLFYSVTKPIDYLQTVYIKVGLPILWGILSFALMWLGMKHKVSTLRIISLTLFSITLVKLFVFDIQNIPPAGKIAAFFCLGVLLLIVSFMYQKVKKIIVEDDKQK